MNYEFRTMNYLTNKQITHLTNHENRKYFLLSLASCVLSLASSTLVERTLQITPFYAKQTQS